LRVDGRVEEHHEFKKKEAGIFHGTDLSVLKPF
jgi:hypothetical protein